MERFFSVYKPPPLAVTGGVGVGVVLGPDWEAAVTELLFVWASGNDKVTFFVLYL